MPACLLGSASLGVGPPQSKGHQQPHHWECVKGWLSAREVQDTGEQEGERKRLSQQHSGAWEPLCLLAWLLQLPITLKPAASAHSSQNSCSCIWGTDLL